MPTKRKKLPTAKTKSKKTFKSLLLLLAMDNFSYTMNSEIEKIGIYHPPFKPFLKSILDEKWKNNAERDGGIEL